MNVTGRDNSDSLRQLEAEIDGFLRGLDHPIVVEDGAELFDLTVADWRLALEFDKLVFEAWNDVHSVIRRVEGIAYRQEGRLGVQVRKQAGRETTTMELRDRQWSEPVGEAASPIDRARFRRQLLDALAREYPRWRLERVSHRSDREHSFSAWYTRGWARQGGTAWAFLGLREDENPAAADAVLAFGLIWLDWLRNRAERITVSGLKLFLPPAAVEVTAHRAAYLDPRAIRVEIWNASSLTSSSPPARVDLGDYGNVQTRLVPRHERQALVDRHRNLVRDLLGDLGDGLDMVPDASGRVLSLRVLGLEFAHIEGDLAPRVYFGLDGTRQKLGEGNRAEFREFVERITRLRSARSQDRSHELYRLQGERWLESLLIRDITKIDPALSPDHVYPQVPAFSGPASAQMHRGVIDILGVTQSAGRGMRNRLAVIELKVSEEINLPLQGLDYWLRVKWLQERGQFKEFGYFSGTELSNEAPLLYLVCPAFRFHSTTGRMLRYLHPSIEVVQVGLNDQWRDGVKVLFRRVLKPGED